MASCRKYYKFPCGCRFKIDDNLPAVNGHPAIIYDIENIPLDCPNTWNLISSGRTKGVFQLESGLGKQWSKRIQPRSIEELADLVAALRPGSLKAKSEEYGISMTELYCRRKHGELPVEYSIPALEPILKRTYGIIIYQEQAIAIASILAGFSLQEADILRKAIGKKDTEAMSKARKMFLDKAKEVGILNEEEAVIVFDNIQKSQRYSFNLAHAVSYAMHSYQTAHYKAHFPLYFYTAYLRCANDRQDPMKEIKALINDARSFNIEVLPPSFTDIRKHFGTDGTNVLFGLADISKIGDKKVDKLRQAVAAIEKGLGKPCEAWTWYEVLMSFSDEIDRTTMIQMIRAGAFRHLDIPRQLLLAEYDAYSRLKDGEKRAIALLGEPIYETKRLYDGRKARRDEAGNVVYQVNYDNVLDEPRNANSLTEAITAILDRPDAVSSRRRKSVESILGLLHNPPCKLEDTPHSIAKMEEETLGVPITYSRVETADRHSANATCKEFRLGETRKGLITLCVEINEINEITIKNGDSRGKLMAKMVVSDETGTIDGVTVFAKAYEKYGHILQRPDNVVIITGRRDRKDESTLIIDKVDET